MTDAVRLIDERQSARMRDDEHRLWADYIASPSTRSRETLFRLYTPLARRLAAKYVGLEARSSIEYEDLLQLAYTGLLESIDRFKPELGVPFRYFANRRINGAILNGIAKHSEVSQQISVRRRMARERMASLHSGENKPSTLDEALAAIGDIAAGLALGLILEESRDNSGEVKDPAPSAFETMAWKQTVKHVREGIEQLPPRERNIMMWHYVDGLRFDQIGELTGLTKGRISQLHKAAIALLRKRLLNGMSFRLEG